jgi:transcriptional regulator with GAF, ATPase, and Fis domain
MIPRRHLFADRTIPPAARRLRNPNRMNSVDYPKLLATLMRFDAEIFDRRVESAAEAALAFVELELQLPYASLVLCDADPEATRIIVRSDARTISSGPLPPGARPDIVARAVETRQAAYYRDVLEEVADADAFPGGPPGAVRALAVQPLCTREAVVGTLNVGSDRVDGVSAETRGFLAAAAPRLASALRSAQLFEALQRTCESLQQECAHQRSALKKSHDELEREVAARTAEIHRLHERLQAENTYLKEELAGVHSYGGIIGENPALKALIARLVRVAPTGANVLILGESGTGKELIAREIHRQSARWDRPMIKVNCATIPKDLYESEFFGHIKGAFTGAVSDRMGRFEAADGGTLFLDEVGEIPLQLQAKLLRVVQEGEFERVGEGRTRKVDVRIIAATNKILDAEVKAGRFREDLYYRLNVFPIKVSPLRERKEDIPLLAAHFIEVISKRLNRPVPKITQANLSDLTGHDWPGNVRELQNVIERALILSQDGRLHFDLGGTDSGRSAGYPRTAEPDMETPAAAIRTDAEIKALQRRNMLAALTRSGWKIYGPNGAARILGIKPTTLIERMRRLQIKKPF